MSDVVMPQLGETVTEGTITKWFKQPGDTVAQDEVLFEVSTDKVDSEVPSPLSGTLTEILVAEGDTVDVGTVLAVIGDAGAAPAAAAAAPPAAAPAPAPAAVPAPTPAAPPVAAPPSPPAAAPPPPPPPAAPAPPPPPPPAAPAPPPPPAVAPAAAVAPVAATATAVAGGAAAGQLLSPVVRKLVNEHNIDTSTITGTGIGGRITRSDVEAVIQSGHTGTAAPAPPPAPVAPIAPARPAAPAPAPAPAASVAPAAPAPAAAPAATSAAPAAASGARDTVLPLNNIRRITGEYMVESKKVSPHVLTAVEVDFEGVERVRQAHRAEFKAEEGFSLTYLPFIARAVCDTLNEFPHMNASVDATNLTVHNYVNLAIAVDLNFEGLLAPVIADADNMRLRGLARSIVDKAGRARSKKLAADEISGGTFTLTNPGQYGTMMQFPIINQPQVAILSTDGISRKPVVVEDAHGNESIAIHSVGVLALAWDHRAFDGAYAAAFLNHLRTIIETRDWEAEIQ